MASIPAAARGQQPARDLVLGRLPIVTEDGRQRLEAGLGDVLSLMLERNVPLESAMIARSIAESRLRAAEGRLNPVLTNSVHRGREVSPSPIGSADDSFLTLFGSDVTRVRSELSKVSERGITYGVAYQETHSEFQPLAIPREGSDPATGEAEQPLSSSALTASVSVPLGRDYGKAINRIPARRAVQGLARSRAEIGAERDELVRQAAGIYWDLVAAHQEVRLRTQAAGLSGRLLRDSEARESAGTLSPAGVQVVETQLARDRQALAAARSEVSRIEDLVRTLLDMERLDYGLKPLDVPAIRAESASFEQAYGEAAARSPVLASARTRLAENALDLEEARNADRTDLDVDLFYTLQGHGDQAFEGGSRFGHAELDNYGVTLTWTVPLFDRTTPERILEATLQRRRLELDDRNVRSELSLQVQSALRQLTLAAEEVRTAQVALGFSEQQLENELERFRLGRGTAFQVSQVQQEVTVSRTDELRARVRYEKNQLDLDVLTGAVYRRYDLPEDL